MSNVKNQECGQYLDTLAIKEVEIKVESQRI